MPRGRPRKNPHPVLFTGRAIEPSRPAVVAELPPDDPDDFVDSAEMPEPEPASIVESLPDNYDENIVLIPTAQVSANGYKSRRIEGNLPMDACVTWHEILRGLILSGAELNATEHKPVRKVKTLFHAVIWVAQNVIPK